MQRVILIPIQHTVHDQNHRHGESKREKRKERGGREAKKEGASGREAREREGQMERKGVEGE